MARTTSEKSVSLFPFLAVLVCTMGALILLLLLTTRRIQKEQHAESQPVDSEISLDVDDIEQSFGLTIDEEMPKTVAKVGGSSVPDNAPTERPETAPLSALELPASEATDEFGFPNFNLTEPNQPDVTEFELKVEIDRLTAALDAERQRHADLLAQIAASEQKLADSSVDDDLQKQAINLSNLKQQESVLRGQLSTQQLALTELKGELDRMSRTTEEAERILRIRESALVSLRKLTEDTSTHRTATAAKTLLEFTNATGTSQRPIVVEVSDSGLRFLPSDVLISGSQMEGFPQNDNPLLSGIAALHEKLRTESGAASPYVLLLVRPDGSLPFYSAQKTLKTAGVNFGYELVDQDKQVFVGRAAENEKQVLQSAVEAAIKRKNQLYGGMLAEIQRLQANRNERPEREARLMPDGRITVPGEKDHNLSGRFFAGGELPNPRPSFGDRPFTAPQRQSGSEEPAAVVEQSADIPNPFESALMKSAELPTASLRDELAEENAPLVSLPAPDMPNPFAMNDRGAASKSTANQSDASQDTMRIEDLLAGGSDETRSSDPEPNQTPLSDSLMAGGLTEAGDQFTSQQFGSQQFSADDQPLATAIPQDRRSTSLAQENSSLPNRIDLDWLNQSPLTSLEAPATESGSSLPPDWSESVTAPADKASRTVGAAQNSFSSPRNGQPSEPVDLMVTLQENADTTGGQPIFGEHQESALSKFMRSVDSELEANRPDPFLVSLLETARITHSEKVAAKDLLVTVILQNSTLQVGSSPAISIAGMSDQQVLNATLERLAAEVETQQTDNGSIPTPSVDFRVDDKSEKLRSRLQQQLQRMDVPVRSATIVSPASFSKDTSW